MKKLVFYFAGLLLISCVLCSCSPSRLFMLNTNGIATYNRNTGQFEVLWEWAETQPNVIHDTVYVDSCKVNQRIY